MYTWLLLTGLLTVEPTGPPAGTAVESEWERASGTWEMMYTASNGTSFGESSGRGDRLGPIVLLREGIAIVDPDDTCKLRTVWRVRVVNAARAVKEIDLEREEGGMTIVRRGLCRIDANLLRCKLAGPGEARPKVLEYGGTGDMADSYVLRRVK